MRPQKISEEDLIDAIYVTMKTYGYEGTSMNDLEEATGLKKASLYHRFPGGKKEMALAALGNVYDWIESHVYELLSDSSIAPKKRLEEVIKNIRIIYTNGKTTCLLRSLGTERGVEKFGMEIQASMAKWIEGFEKLGRDFGYEEEEAKEKAQMSIVLIQGGLVITLNLDSVEVFDIAIKNCEAQYDME